MTGDNCSDLVISCSNECTVMLTVTSAFQFAPAFLDHKWDLKQKYIILVWYTALNKTNTPLKNAIKFTSSALCVSKKKHKIQEEKKLKQLCLKSLMLTITW